MGRYKEYELEDDGFTSFLKELIKLDYLVDDKTALGITKKVISDGIDSLSEKQKYVFDTYVLGEFTVSECSRCGGSIPWSEMINALSNGGMCGYCDHIMSKDD